MCISQRILAQNTSNKNPQVSRYAGFQNSSDFKLRSNQGMQILQDVESIIFFSFFFDMLSFDRLIDFTAYRIHVLCLVYDAYDWW